MTSEGICSLRGVKMLLQLYLEHISREKGEEDDDKRKHEADVLNPGGN